MIECYNLKQEKGDEMSKNLVIVESPAKSKTIEKYLGKDFVVLSSKGHIRDLTTRGFGGFGVDIENEFAPMYKVMKDKKDVVKTLKKEIKNSDKVYLATDPDREGEAISWHLFDELGLDDSKYERIVFNEITKTAVLHALENSRKIDQDLVHSQESRRILDRIIGFSLSKLLQKKIGSKSAGRVQSVALKLIVDREKEIQAFNPEEYWEIYLEFAKKTSKLKAKLIAYKNEKIDLKTEQDVDLVKERIEDAYKIEEIVIRERERSSRPPFITSTLQQDASAKFNFTSKRTMMVAQKLYEGIELKDERVGLITYMRTDSTRLSGEFLGQGKNYIEQYYGKEYYRGYKDFSTKQNVQDAHEAIRPSHVKYHPDDIRQYLSNDEYKLYALIYYRSLAALMKNAVIEEEKLKIENQGYSFEAIGERVLFPGFLKAMEQFEKDTSKSLPRFEVGEILQKTDLICEQKFTSPPMRYSESRLIKKMEELGIGRPSTYAVTIDTLKYRHYVKMEKKVFIPTDQGILTSDKLQEYFSSIINVAYTARMEDDLDEIALGKKVWHLELKDFYERFMPVLEFAGENMEKIYPKVLDELCPECGSNLVVRNGRFGEFVACGGFPKCRYIKKEEKEVVKTGLTCPVCETGDIVERISKRGRSKGQKFFACSRYPKCKTTYSTLEDAKKDKQQEIE